MPSPPQGRRLKVLAKPPLSRRRAAQRQTTALQRPSSSSATARVPPRTVALEKPCTREALTTPKHSYTPGVTVSFSLLGVDLGKTSLAKKRPASSSTSETSEARPTKKRQRTRQLVDGLMQNSDLSLLEKSAVGPWTAKMYVRELEEFIAFGRPRGLDFMNAENLDKLAVDYMNELYLRGYLAYRGDRLTATILHHHPEYGRHGSKKLPACGEP